MWLGRQLNETRCKMSVNLADRARPASYAELLGQEKAVAALSVVRKLNGSLGGQAFWLAGPSGSGKTSLARLIASEVAGEGGDVREYLGGAMSVADVESMSDGWRLRPMFGHGHASIIDEAHLLSGKTIGRLLRALEPVPDSAVVILTTTVDGGDLLFDKLDGGPLFSRCKRLPMAQRGLAELFAGRAQQLAESLGVGGAPAEKYLRAVKDARNNLRAVLQLVESGEFSS